uniref:Uncharacterized protein n=1 Tax=Chelonoidis abingdonii TaxID=106734 RepID=A0A8C0FZ39_CHEAB
LQQSPLQILTMTLGGNGQHGGSLESHTWHKALHRLLGKWFYIAGASQHPRTLQEMELIENAYYFFYPSSHQDKFLVTQFMRLGCHSLSSRGRVRAFGVGDLSASLCYCESLRLTVGTMQPLYLLKPTLTNDFLQFNLSFLKTARAQNLSTEQLEEFKTQVACLGLKEEETFYASSKVKINMRFL